MHDEGGVDEALVWNEVSGIIDVNSEGRYNTQLAEWMYDFGVSQYSYMFEQTNQYMIAADSDEEVIVFSDETSEWTPAVSEFDPGAPDFFYRTVNGGSRDVIVMCDNEGKLCEFIGDNMRTGWFQATDDGSQLSWTDVFNSSTQATIEQNCGGTSEVTVEYSGAGASVWCVRNESCKVTINDDGYVTSGIIDEWQG